MKCSIFDCAKPVVALTLCGTHHARLRRTGTTDAVPLEVRKLWRRTAVKASGCIEWTGPVNSWGYGSVMWNGVRTGVHRLAYMLTVGDIPPNKVIDHICHNRICVNPRHLRPATTAENGQNRSGASDASTTGVRNVFQAPGGRYRVDVSGKYIGIFDTLSEADTAARAARAKLQPFSGDALVASFADEVGTNE